MLYQALLAFLEFLRRIFSMDKPATSEIKTSEPPKATVKSDSQLIRELGIIRVRIEPRAAGKNSRGDSQAGRSVADNGKPQGEGPDPDYRRND